MGLVDENEKVVDIGKDGEIQVKTYSVLKEYKTEEQKTRELFTQMASSELGKKHLNPEQPIIPE